MEQGRHPLDFLYPNNSLLLLETMIPYVEPSLRLPLALFIKFQEIQYILKAFHNPQTMSACGFGNAPSSMEDILLALCQSMGMDVTEQLKNAQNLQTMMSQMQSFQTEPKSDNDSNDFSHSREEMMDAIREILEDGR